MYFTELLRGVSATNLFPRSCKFNLSCLLCTEMGPLNISPLPTRMMLSIIIGAHCRDVGGGRTFPPSFSLSHSAGSWSLWSFQYQSLTGSGFSSTQFLQCVAASSTQQPPSHPNTSLHNIGATSEVPHMPINCFPHPQPPEDEFPAGATNKAPWYLLYHPVGHGQAFSNERWI